ncbi:MAG: tyrosine-type recombinase/integrase [Mangrovibacterium sp.]
MRSTFKILCYINRSKVKADGTTAVLCRISIDGKQAVLTTGIYCKPEDWNAAKGIIKIARENNRLMEFRNRVEHTYEHILKESGVVSSELLKNTMLGVNTTPTSLLQSGEVELERLRIRSIAINSTSTYRQSRLSQKNVQDFLLSKGMKDIALADITEDFGKSFKIFLKVANGRSSNYVNRCLTWLNRLVYIAIDQEVLRSNPLEDVYYEKKAPVQHPYVSSHDLKRLLETPLKDERMELTRRAFLFSSLTGLAFADIYSLYPQHIGKTSEGRQYIRKQRVKTKVEAFIPLHPIAEQLLMLYNTEDDANPVFPLPPRDKVWYEINQIGKLMGLKENLSYHKSRHSFGTLAISSGLPIESIAKMMGHANISTTQGYAKITEQKISKDMDKLMKRRETKYNHTNQISNQ